MLSPFFFSRETNIFTVLFHSFQPKPCSPPAADSWKDLRSDAKKWRESNMRSFQSELLSSGHLSARKPCADVQSCRQGTWNQNTKTQNGKTVQISSNHFNSMYSYLSMKKNMVAKMFTYVGFPRKVQRFKGSRPRGWGY